MKRTICALTAFTSITLAISGQVESAVPTTQTTGTTTILKLNLGADVDDDIKMSSGQFETIDDGNSGTSGYQNTGVEFAGFLDSLSDITASSASFTLGGLTPMPNSITFGGWLVEQDFYSGAFSLYGSDNSLLLSADLSISAVTGPLGSPGSQGLFLAMGEVTGGSIAPRLLPTSLRLRMRLPTINAGGGFSVSPSPSYPAPEQYFAPLNSFSAGATVEIRAIEAPEPVVALSIVGAVAMGLWPRRGRRAHG